MVCRLQQFDHQYDHYVKDQGQMYLTWYPLTYGPRRKKTCLQGFANNTGADQPAHLRRLISAFFIGLSRSIISRLATSKILIFLLVSVAEETGLKLA